MRSRFASPPPPPTAFSKTLFIMHARIFPSAVLAVALSLHASFICTATADLTNTGFEQGTENWASFVPDEAKDAETSFTVVSENPHSGSRVAKLTSTKFARHGCTPAGSQATLKVTPGERYRITAWVRADADAKPQDNTPGVLVRLALQGPDKKDAPGGHYYAGLNNWIARDRQPPASKLLPTEWSKIESVFQIPDDAAYMSLTLFAWRVQGSVYFDDVSLEKVSGDTPITPLESVTNSGFEQDMTDWAYFCPPNPRPRKPPSPPAPKILIPDASPPGCTLKASPVMASIPAVKRSKFHPVNAG